MSNETKIKEFLITTIDNPYNPFSEYEDWLRFDEENGYNTQNYVARVLQVKDLDDSLSEDEKLDIALESILSINQGLYVKVFSID